ncbi:hypothetical protein D3C85_1727700 [compost metagenome]
MTDHLPLASRSTSMTETPTVDRAVFFSTSVAVAALYLPPVKPRILESRFSWLMASRPRWLGSTPGIAK